MFNNIVDFIRTVYKTDQFIPLHEPRFLGNEKKYLEECIDSTFVSSVGKFVDLFEEKCAEYTGAKYAVAVVNGTQALFVAMKLVGVEAGTEVLTQALTFVATANAIQYIGAEPVFIDVDVDTMGLSPTALKIFLESETSIENGKCINIKTERLITGCVPMHTFGNPCRIREIKEICQPYGISVIEDSAESLGSYVDGIHTGTIGDIGILSFNGNKTITTGGGGMILTNDESIAKQGKHLTTTAKMPHAWEFIHDQIGYNFRMPNLNAALGLAQLEQLPDFLASKKKLADTYETFFSQTEIKFFRGLSNTYPNNWLNTVILEDQSQRDQFLKSTNELGVMTRCLWRPMHKLPMFSSCQTGPLDNTEYYYERTVNIPSSVLPC